MHHLFAEDNFVFIDKFDTRKEGSRGATQSVALWQGYQWFSWTRLQDAGLTCSLVLNKMTKAAATFIFIVY